MRGTGVGYGVNHAEGAKIYIISSGGSGETPRPTGPPQIISDGVSCGVAFK